MLLHAVYGDPVHAEGLGSIRNLEWRFRKDGFNPTDLPKAICAWATAKACQRLGAKVTFYFFWGKYLVWPPCT